MLDSQADFDERLAKLRPIPPSVSTAGIRLDEPKGPSFDKQPAVTATGGRYQRKGNWWSLGNYARFPYRLFGSGLGCALGATAGWLLIALFDQANRHGSLRFKASDKTLAANTGISERTIIGARKLLLKKGLIDYSVSPGQSPVYELKAIPEIDIRPKERPREKGKARGRSSPKKADVGKMNASETDDLWDGLPQILRGTNAKYARPHANSADPSRFFNKG